MLDLLLIRMHLTEECVLMTKRTLLKRTLKQQRCRIFRKEKRAPGKDRQHCKASLVPLCFSHTDEALKGLDSLRATFAKVARSPPILVRTRFD